MAAAPGEVLWRPSPERIEKARLTHFRRWLAAREGAALSDYDSLHRWSVEHLDAFWSAWADYAGLRFEGAPGPVRAAADRLETARFFPDGRLSHVDNLLAWADREPRRPALRWADERGPLGVLDFAALRDRAFAFAGALRDAGVGPGDRVAGYLGNGPEAVIAFLATAALGAVWASCSPDFGVPATADRLGQLAPKVLVANTGYRYGGKAFDSGARLPALLARLHSVELVITVADPGIAGTAPPTGVPQRSFADCLGARPIAAAHVGAFGDPLYVLFSSGTTGVPKGIVHGLGGVLLQHGKEHALHCDLGAGDVLFFFTTCGWMMWNWQLSALARGVTIGLYDGSPFHPHAGSLPALLETWGVTAFGAGARYFAGLQQAGYRPRSRHDLSRLRTVMSTGSPLAPAGFEFVYDALKHDVCLASISGGTDLVSCFALGCPTLPVRAGELQVPGLAMDVAFLRPDGSVCARGEAGELVCRRPFPTQPVAFWNDADGTRLHEAYYARHPGVWAHGDFGEVTEQGGIVIHGRADAVLNPGGVRIGTAELYRLVEALPWVAEALAVGQRQDADERIVLFLVLAPGETLDAARQDALRAHIRAGATPRHVPARIVAVADLPRTVNGKLAEIAVRQTIHGEPVTNVDALANPEVLALFRALPELEDCGGR